MIVVGITGASGVIYGIRLLKALNELNIKNSLIIIARECAFVKHFLRENSLIHHTCWWQRERRGPWWWRWLRS